MVRTLFCLIPKALYYSLLQISLCTIMHNRTVFHMKQEHNWQDYNKHWFEQKWKRNKKNSFYVIILGQSSWEQTSGFLAITESLRILFRKLHQEKGEQGSVGPSNKNIQTVVYVQRKRRKKITERRGSGNKAVYESEVL